MPVIVIGADTPLGTAIVEALLARRGEVRLFVSDPGTRPARTKTAVGDLSDASHVAAAALGAFCAVLIEEAACDGRELAFAAGPESVLLSWANAVAEAGVQRAIWVGETGTPPAARPAPEVATVRTAGRSREVIAAEVADLNDAAEL